MSIQPPQGILNIPNATLRVGKLAVDSTAGFDTVFNNVERNTILLVDSTEYTETKQWDLKMPNIFVATFEIKGGGSSFNFRNTSNGVATTGYTLTFSGTTLTLKYGEILSEEVVVHELTTATIPDLDLIYGKVYLTYEKQHFTVTVDGTLVLTYKDTTTRTPPDGEYVNFFAGTGSPGFKNLKVVAGHFISDGTSNIAYVGGGEVAVGKALAFNRVSNVSQIKVDSNVVAEYTGPHDRPLRKYPEVAIINGTLGPTGGIVQTPGVSESQRGYTVTSSSSWGVGGTDTRAAWCAFDEGKSTTTYKIWQSGNYYTTATPGLYNRSPAQSHTANGVNYEGEWIKLELPRKINISKIEINATAYSSLTGHVAGRPYEGAILGSNDDSTWSLLKSFSGGLSWATTTVAEGGGRATLTPDTNTTNKYRYIMLVVNKVQGSRSSVDINEIKYYGYEEGSGSLDTTLKSVYNVPATTGTQLEVYYDGRETSSYSGSGTNVNDISPNTNNGTLNGGVGFDSTYKAFTFDGVDDYIDGTITTGIDAWSHTVAFWVKIDEFNGAPFFIIDPSADGADPAASTAPHLFANTNGTLNYAFWSNAGNFLDDNGNQLIAQKGVWQHYVVQYDASTGGTNYTDRKLIINGNQTYYPAAGTATALNMSASNNLHIGGRFNSSVSIFFNGSIANFRLYSKALNAGQVQELYDYQKDYFLGSKSQVTLYKGHLGVGVTEPSGQLELAGDERIQEYPPGPMDGYETLIPGHGVFCASASSYYSSSLKPYNAFNKITTSGTSPWISSGNPDTFDELTGLASTADSFEGTSGPWIKLKLPYNVKPKKVQMFMRTTSESSSARKPKSGIVYGLKDGTYHRITNFDFGSTDKDIPLEEVNLNTHDFYSEFVLQITSMYLTGISTDAIAIKGINYFGTPGPTTLDKGSLSLGRSLDVPRISRYDVDTETPRPEKLVVDFDTTVNSSPTDISGQGNHGTFKGTNMNYSSAYKAFVFNGTDDYIQSSGVTLPTAHSMSVWFNMDSDQSGINSIMHIGTFNTGDESRIFTSGNILNATIYGSTIQYDTSLSPGNWYHVVYTFTDGTTFNTTNAKIYVNGQLIPTTQTQTAATLNLVGNTVTIGATSSGAEAFKGKISNPKLYSVVLEPSEVQKLYRLGRTGRSMVISDTAVGIGKVPEAQLDVRGVATFGSIINSRGVASVYNSGSWTTGTGIELGTLDWEKYNHHQIRCRFAGTNSTFQRFNARIRVRQVGDSSFKTSGYESFSSLIKKTNSAALESIYDGTDGPLVAYYCDTTSTNNSDVLLIIDISNVLNGRGQIQIMSSYTYGGLGYSRIIAGCHTVTSTSYDKIKLQLEEFGENNTATGSFGDWVITGYR
jgi:hypothetical protein